MADDTDPWENRRQAEAQREAAQGELADIDRMLAERAERQARQQAPAGPQPVRREWSGTTFERAPQLAPQRTFHRNWEAEQRWVEKIIDQHFGKVAIEATGIAIARLRKELIDGEMVPFADAVGDEVNGLVGRIKAQDDRIAALEATVAELRAEIAAERSAKTAEARYAALEARLAEAEQRAGPPVRRIA